MKGIAKTNAVILGLLNFYYYCTASMNPLSVFLFVYPPFPLLCLHLIFLTFMNIILALIIKSKRNILLKSFNQRTEGLKVVRLHSSSVLVD